MEKQQLARRLCVGLGVFDLILGGTAAFFPRIYASIFHPELASPPVDFIVRTGFIWLFFCAVQFRAGLGRTEARWFFLVAALRLMDVPADLAYAFLAAGAPWWSRAVIYSAPVFNAVIGLFLWSVSKR